MRKNPEQVSEILEASRQLLDAGDHAAAVKGFLKCFPANAEQQTEAALGLSIIYIMEGRPDEVVARLSPCSNTAHVAFGKLVHLLLGYAHGAMGNAADRDASYAAYVKLITRHHQWDGDDERLEYFAEYILDSPGILGSWAQFVRDKEYGRPVALDLLNWCGFAFSVFMTGISETRATAFREHVNDLLDAVLQIDPGYGGEVWFRKGEWLINEDNDAAYDCYRKAIEVFPDHFNSHQTLGRYLLGDEAYEPAVIHLERCREINEAYDWEDSSSLIDFLTTAYWLLAEEKVKAADYAAAEALFRKYLALEHPEMYIGPAAEDLWIAVAEGYANQSFAVDAGDSRDAIALRYADIAVTVAPSAKSYALQGILLNNSQQQEASLLALQAGMALDSEYYYLHYALACTYAKMGSRKKKAALEAIRKSLELNPGFRNNLRYETDFLEFAKDKEFLDIFARKRK